MVIVLPKDHDNVNFTEANHSWVSRKLWINSDDDVSLFLLYHRLQLNKGSTILLLLEKKERKREGRKMWEDRRVSGEDGRGGRGKIKKRGREREGGKGEKEKENNCIQNVIIKKQKDIAKFFFFFCRYRTKSAFPGIVWTHSVLYYPCMPGMSLIRQKQMTGLFAKCISGDQGLCTHTFSPMLWNPWHSYTVCVALSGAWQEPELILGF